MKTFITSILMFAATTGFAQDTTKVDYIKIFELDTLNSGGLDYELFGMLLSNRYSSLGEWNMMMVTRFDDNIYWDIETICIEFINPRPHWECYTPAELETKLTNKKSGLRIAKEEIRRELKELEQQLKKLENE